MDAKKLVEPPNPVASEQPTIGLLQASTESLDASIRRAQEALSAVSARLARQGVTVSQPTDRFVETDVMSPAEARALAERCTLQFRDLLNDFLVSRHYGFLNFAIEPEHEGGRRHSAGAG